MEGDFQERFSSANTDVWSAMESLIPCWNEKFLNAQLPKPLFAYILTIPAARNKLRSEKLNESNLAAECQVFQRVLTKELENGTFKHDTRDGVTDLNKVRRYMVKNHGEAAPILCILYRISVTAGYASARCECVFSSLTKVDAPQRRKQTLKRETNLTFLYFERKAMMDLKFEDFFRIWSSKPRKLKFD